MTRSNTSGRATLPIPDYSVENLTRGLTLASPVHLAGTSAQRRRGLLGVGELAAETGMWIDPCEAIHTFGMKWALDAVFLDAHFRIRKIAPSLRPNRIAVCLTACSVLELKAGRVAESGTCLGDQLSFLEIESRNKKVLSSALPPADKTT